MNKKFVSLLKSISISAFLLAGCLTVNFHASPLNTDVNVFNCPVQTENRKFYVSDSRELALRANSAENGDEIILNNDIFLDTKICLKSSCCLNLNGYTIWVDNSDNIWIDMGRKEFSHVETYTVRHPGYYAWEEKVKTINHPNQIVRDAYGNLISVPVAPTKEVTQVQVWHPETFETRPRNVYKYYDDIDIAIKNGRIEKFAGRKGQDGLKDVWFDFNGENGYTPGSPMFVISGTIRFYNVVVKGGDGGNGGNGGYQSLLHMPFGGGNAGNGGDGANGGSAIYSGRKEVVILKDFNSQFLSGRPGKGGKAGTFNPNYWLSRGWKGSDGKDGKESSPVLNMG